jgi:hypothetical protein
MTGEKEEGDSEEDDEAQRADVSKDGKEIDHIEFGENDEAEESSGFEGLHFLGIGGVTTVLFMLTET